MFGNKSTFKGFLQDPELNFMAIDYFGETTRSCNVFLVSHHHADHTHGLREFVDILNESSNQFIYTSPLTGEFLKNSFNILPDKIIPLSINKSTIVYELDDSYVCVTCLPAAHCPGSVMLLIEYNNKKILYTGDFRMDLKYFKISQKYLMNNDGSFKGIDDLYLDSTFALPSDFDNFPAREDSEKLILNMVEEWLLKSDGRHKVIIEMPACIGTEYLFFSIVKTIKSRIIVHDSNYNRFYNGVEEMSTYLESANDLAQKKDWLIHACNRSNCVNSLAHDKNYKIRVIKPCALSFFKGYNEKILNWKFGVPYTMYKNYGYNSAKVFYSSHSSLKELQEVVHFVKPKNIFFNTKYDDAVDLMYSLFKIKTDTNDENCIPNESQCAANKSKLATKNDYLEFQKLKEQTYKKLKLF